MADVTNTHRADLIEQITQDQRTMSMRTLPSLLSVDLTLPQLKIVLVVTGTAKGAFPCR